MNLIVIEVEQHICDDHETVECGDYTTSGPDVHNFYQVAVVELLEEHIIGILNFYTH